MTGDEYAARFFFAFDVEFLAFLKANVQISEELKLLSFRERERERERETERETVIYMKLNIHKAGMQAVDVAKVEKVLNDDIAKKSKYYHHQETLNQKAQDRIDKFVTAVRLHRRNPHHLSTWEREATDQLAILPRPRLGSYTFTWTWTPFLLPLKCETIQPWRRCPSGWEG